LKQFILKETPGRDRLIRLSGDDYHYLVRVRRLKPGDSFPALLPEGIRETVSVLSTEGGILSGRVSVSEKAGSAAAVSGTAGPEPAAAVSEKAAVSGTAGPAAAVSGTAGSEPAAAVSGEACREQPAVPPIVLFQALPKGAKIDLIVRQAAEGALSGVVVFTAERSVARPEKPAAKEERWRRIVKEARQQSGSAAETAIRFCPSLDAALSHWTALGKQYREALGLLMHQDPLEQGTFHDYLGSSPGLVAVAVGPEGGFSGAEVADFLEAGFRAVRVGDTVLRSETAALYGAAAARIILLERTAWMLKKK
jgi:16S rRNA (uracil1498-N3)-methyltransferase